MKRAATSAKPRPANAGTRNASPWEWAVAGVGAALVVSAIGYLVYFAETMPPGPPLIVVEPGPIARNGSGYVLEVHIANEGATSAAAVEIEGVLSRGGVALETASATLDYVPRFSNRRAGLYFESDPGTADIALRALGYAEP